MVSKGLGGNEGYLCLVLVHDPTLRPPRGRDRGPLVDTETGVQGDPELQGVLGVLVDLGSIPETVKSIPHPPPPTAHRNRGIPSSSWKNGRSQ